MCASPQTENGFTRIANELLEEVLLYDYPSASALKLLLCVMRQTYGYNKKEDIISISQFQKHTHLSRPTVVYWLDRLVKALLLVKGDKLYKSGFKYSLNKNYHQWKLLVKPLELVKGRAFTSKPPFTVTSKPPFTYKRKKDNITKEIGDKSPNKKKTLQLAKQLVNILLKEKKLRKPDGDYKLANLFPAQTLIKDIEHDYRERTKKEPSPEIIEKEFQSILQNMDDFNYANASSIIYITKHWGQILSKLKKY